MTLYDAFRYLLLGCYVLLVPWLFVVAYEIVVTVSERTAQRSWWHDRVIVLANFTALVGLILGVFAGAFALFIALW